MKPLKRVKKNFWADSGKVLLLLLLLLLLAARFLNQNSAKNSLIETESVEYWTTFSGSSFNFITQEQFFCKQKSRWWFIAKVLLHYCRPSTLPVNFSRINIFEQFQVFNKMRQDTCLKRGKSHLKALNWKHSWSWCHKQI